MSLIKLNKNRFPFMSDGITNWLDTDDFFADDFFVKKASLPALNVKENEKSFEVELAVPGFSKKDIEVSLDNDMLFISGKNSKEEETKEDNYTRKDFNYSSFERKMQLPQSIDQSKDVKAHYKNGVLTLELNKKAEAIEQPKKTIAIQ